jgi:hypothetical protein
MGGRSDVKGGMRVATALAITCFLLFANQGLLRHLRTPAVAAGWGLVRTYTAQGLGGRGLESARHLLTLNLAEVRRRASPIISS